MTSIEFNIYVVTLHYYQLLTLYFNKNLRPFNFFNLSSFKEEIILDFYLISVIILII